MRSPVKVQVLGGAPGISPWVVLDYTQRPFNVGVFATPSEDAATQAYSVQYTPDNPNQTKGTRNPVVSQVRVAGVVTLTWLNDHGLTTGDAAKVYNSGDANLDGDVQVASTPTTKSITYAVANTGALAGGGYTEAIPLRVYALQAALTAATTRQSAALTTPAWAVRLNVTALTAGSVVLEVVQGPGRG